MVTLMDTLTGQVNLIWTVQFGILVMLLLMSLVFMFQQGTVVSVRFVVWLTVVFVPTVALNRPFYGEVYQALVPDLHWLKVSGPPLAVLVSGYLLSSWFGVGNQSRALRFTSKFVCVVALAAMVVCPWLPAELGVLLATGVSVGGGLLIALICLWLGRHGSRIGAFLGAGTFFFALVMALHFGLVLGWVQGLAMHLLVATLDLIGILTMSALCVQRCLHESHTRAMHNRLGADVDPSTHLLSAKAFVRALQKSVDGLKGSADTYAVLTVVVENVPGLIDQLGVGGVHDALCLVAARVRAKSGFLTPVGRYYDRCFMILIDRPQSHELVKMLVAALTSSLREPVTIRGEHNEIQNVQLNVGVAAVYFDQREDVSNILFRAESAALRACGKGAGSHGAGEPQAGDRWSSLFPSTSS